MPDHKTLPKFSRRAFNLTLMSAVALTGCNTGTKQEQADVVIIGGGLSGLYSALLLRDFGFNPIVLEAQGEVGGRVKTVETDLGPLDLGASQIGRGYGRAINLCRRFNLNLIPEDRDLLDFGMHYEGGWLDTKNWTDDPRNQLVGEERAIPPMILGRWIASKYNPLISAQDWTDPKFGDLDVSMRTLMEKHGHSKQAIDLARFTVPGVGIDETSMLRMWQEEKRGELERGFTQRAQGEHAKHPFGESNVRDGQNALAAISNIEGGCQSLPKAMAAELGDAVRLNKKVTHISMTDNSASIKCEDGSEFAARFVISALPFSMLRSVKIDAASNPQQQAAIAEMPYANTARLYLTVDEPFWEKDGLAPSFSTDGPMGMFWAIDNARAGGKHRAMIVLVGQSGKQISDVEKPVEFLIEELARLRPASRGLVNVRAFKDWSADPFQKGCGFSMAPGQINSFGRTMRDPWQVMHFAGEHTRQAEFGMEAALESAERVVTEIADRV